MSPRNLLLFNLATDANDPLLAFACTWLNALAPHFDQIDVVTMRVGHFDLANNISVHSLGKEKGASEIQRLWQFYQFLFVLLRERPYVGCFAHMQPLFTSLAGPLLRLKKIPITLWYAHGNVPLRLRFAERWVKNLLTPTPESCRINSEKIQVVGHGIDTDHFQPASFENERSKPFTILYCGRLDPIKRLELLISAAEHLSDMAEFRWQLLIVGEASPAQRDYAEDLRKTSEQRLGQRISFLGRRTYQELPSIYHSADLLWSASGTGSLDKVLLEAMSCGLPVLTCNEAASNLLKPWADDLWIAENSSRENTVKLFAVKTIRWNAQTEQYRQELAQNLRRVVVNQHNLNRLAQYIAAGFSS